MILFETERLFVRQFTATDAEDFYLLNSNEEVMYFIRPPKNRKECDDFLQENLNLYQKDSIVGRYAVIERSSNKIVGTFSFLFLSDKINYHIGYALLTAYWGKGMAQELVRHGIPYFFAASDKTELFAITDTKNIASQNALFKNGFVVKGNTIEHNKELVLFSINRPLTVDHDSPSFNNI